MNCGTLFFEQFVFVKTMCETSFCPVLILELYVFEIVFIIHTSAHVFVPYFLFWNYTMFLKLYLLSALILTELRLALLF